jgi:cytochrome P450
MHRDPDFYLSPNEFNAFRFSEAMEQQSQSETESDPQPGNSFKQSAQASLSLVTLTDNFLPFGAGRHACPGRFFAANELKLLIAHLVDNYDIEKLEERPKGINMIGISLPAGNEMVRTRLRRR